jgi:hypothetical protein
MAVCEGCSTLSGQLSKVEPHAALKFEKKTKIPPSAMASGVVEFYECASCGSTLGRDLDRKDSHAQWYVAKPGN